MIRRAIRSYCYCKSVRYLSSASQLGAKKKVTNSVKKRRISLIVDIERNNEELKALFEPLRKAIIDKESHLQRMKELNAEEVDVIEANKELETAKQQLEDKLFSISTRDDFQKYLIYDLLKRRFINSSFEIYGGLSRVYDFGPLGTKIYENIIDCWKRLFVKEDRCLHVKCPVLTPEKVLAASGHVQRFCDVHVKDTVTGDLFRLDHLISNAINERLESEDLSVELRNEYKSILSSLNQLTSNQMSDVVSKYSITSPITGNKLSTPFEKNLMFKTAVGSKEDIVYLRPELSQSAFINFHKYYEFNRLKLPFAVSQIGSAFRNEISRSTGITRIREFTLAEIQYFFDPQKPTHPKYEAVKHQKLNLYSACDQRENKEPQFITLEEAVNSGLVNQIMGYFFVRVEMFLSQIGVDLNRVRFRQHLSNELAHYAKNCWDVECLTHGGWLECVGVSDRNSFDLENHSNASKNKLTFKRRLSPNVEESKDDSVQLNEEDVFAHVIEPSFGIERLMHTVFDHNFNIRKNDERKAYFSFPNNIAPWKCCILPLGSNDEFVPLVSQIDEMLHSQGIDCDVDDSRNSIGYRYVRNDEIGTPFAVTVDFDSLQEPHTVTLRERDSMKQVRVPVDNLAVILKQLSSNSITFENVCEMYPLFKGQKSILRPPSS